MKNEKTLTKSEAYLAMYYFLEDLYNLTKSGDLGGFLGGMTILEDGRTADPAAWEDWLNAIKKVKEAT